MRKIIEFIKHENKYNQDAFAVLCLGLSGIMAIIVFAITDAIK